jgi:site-specific recombinase XerD
MSKSKLAATSLNHVIVTQSIKGVVGVTVPALYIDVSGKAQIVTSLVSFFLAHPDRSMTWMRARSRALGLFYDYCAALSRIDSPSMSYQDMMARFGVSVAKGTIDPQTATDELQLYWPPSSIENAKRLIYSLREFAEWCSYKNLVPQDLILRKNQLPTNEKSYIRYLYQAHTAKSFMFLGHSLSASKIAREIADLKNLMPVNFSAKTSKTVASRHFPDQYVSLLLTEGFVKNTLATDIFEREDITAKMITILMMFGGTRHSEPYHLWFNDVIPQVDGSCKVFLRHPSEAETYIPAETVKSRKQYLYEHGLSPRNSNSSSKSYKAGWKNLQVDEDYSAPVQFIHPAAEKMFRELYVLYIKSYRPKLMKWRNEKGGNMHPFLFISNWSGDIGAPYSMSAYRGALERAFNRLNKAHGLNLAISKKAGTSPHGMRHYFGQALTDLGVDMKIIQKCLRHRTISAQSVYTEPNGKKIRIALDNAIIRIQSGASQIISDDTIMALEHHG